MSASALPRTPSNQTDRGPRRQISAETGDNYGGVYVGANDIDLGREDDERDRSSIKSGIRTVISDVGILWPGSCFCEPSMPLCFADIFCFIVVRHAYESFLRIPDSKWSF